MTLWDWTSCRVKVLVLFVSVKPEARRSFWIELAAPCTLTNHNEINSDDTLPFIIFLTLVSCDGSNRLWRQHLLLLPCSLWRHKQTLIGVIRPLAGGKCRTFCRVIERYRFHRYLCFHCVFCVRVFCILFYTKRVTISYYNCIHSSSTLILFCQSIELPNQGFGEANVLKLWYYQIHIILWSSWVHLSSLSIFALKLFIKSKKIF